MNQKLTDSLNSLKKYLANDLVKNIKENWRILLVAIIVIAVFANSWEDDQRTPNIPQEQASENTSNQPEQNTAGEEEKQPASDSNIAQAKEESNVLGENVIKETAAKSEGVTHLARRAVKEYLENSKETLSPEQKIYAEDYLKRQIGSQPLEIGQTIEFKTDTIKTGVEKAKTLNQKEIENLSKFVPLVKNLN